MREWPALFASGSGHNAFLKLLWFIFDHYQNSRNLHGCNGIASLGFPITSRPLANLGERSEAPVARGRQPEPPVDLLCAVVMCSSAARPVLSGLLIPESPSLPGNQDSGHASEKYPGRDDIRRVHRSKPALREENNQGEKKAVHRANSSSPHPGRPRSQSKANHHGHKNSF